MTTRLRPLPTTRSVAVLTFPNGQSLDVSGPIEVFSGANRLWARDYPNDPPPYAVQLLAPAAGTVPMSSGLKLIADRGYAAVRKPPDTLIVAGGQIDATLGDAALLRWLAAMALRVRRVAAVCTGAFLLAEAGALDGRRATTHWAAVARFIARYPRVEVEPDAIFVQSGNVHTSAGVTAGIDLALSLVEADLGHPAAVAVARHLVVFLKRPGGQSQFSSHLAAQHSAPGVLGDLPDWVLAHLRGDLGVERLAARAAMSPRNFARVFRREMGCPPAKFVERARVDAARRGLEDAARSLDEVADAVGFASAEQMRRAFQRNLGVVPHDYRRRFHRQAA